MNIRFFLSHYTFPINKKKWFYNVNVGLTLFGTLDWYFWTKSFGTLGATRTKNTSFIRYHCQIENGMDQKSRTIDDDDLLLLNFTYQTVHGGDKRS